MPFKPVPSDAAPGQYLQIDVSGNIDAVAISVDDIAGVATDTELTDHIADTTSVHGITDTSTLYRSGGTDVAVADGGTGASDAAGARTALGLAIGSDVQAFDTQLSHLAGLAYSGNALKVVRVNAGETAFELAAASGADGLGPDGDKGDITVGGSGTTLTIDANAVTFAKMQAVSANILLGNDAAGTAVEEIACTAAGRAILDDADAAAQRTTLGLGTIATQAANSVAITGGSVTGITDLAIADGGTGASTAQAAIDALTAVAGATNEHVLTKDTASGNAIFKAVPGGGTAASQAEQETGTSTTVYVSPGRQHFHPSAAKAWVASTQSSTTIQLSYNVASVADTATGRSTITFTTNMSDTNYVVIPNAEHNSASGTTQTYQVDNGGRAVGSYIIESWQVDGTEALTDPSASWFSVVFGDI